MRISYYTVHSAFWFVLVLFPIVTRVGGGTNLAQKLIHVFFLSMFMLFIVILKHNPINRKVTMTTLFFFITLVFYYTFCTLFFTPDLIASDFGDLTRPILYSLYFFIPLLYPIDKGLFNRLFKFLILLCLFQIAFSLFVYIPKLWPLVDFYKGRTSNDIVLMHFYRWSGTFIYPSDFSFYLSFFIYFYFFNFVDGKYLKVQEWVVVFLLFVALLMTFSRGGLFTTVGMLGISYWFTKAKYNLKVNALLGVGALLLMVMFIKDVGEEDVNYQEANYFNIEYVFDSLKSKEDSDASTQHRYNELSIANNYALKVFPFGIGSNRQELNEVIPVIESFYGYHLIKWGWLGLALYLSSQITIFLYLKNSIPYVKSRVELSFVKAVMVLIASVPLLFGLSSAISDRFKGLPFYYLLLGLSVMVCIRYRKGCRVCD